MKRNANIIKNTEICTDGSSLALSAEECQFYFSKSYDADPDVVNAAPWSDYCVLHESLTVFLSSFLAARLSSFSSILDAVFFLSSSSAAILSLSSANSSSDML